MKEYTFCPFCGKKGSIMRVDTSHFTCVACGKHLWDNPKTAVAVVFLSDDGDILVAQRGRNPQKDKFDFPGGFIEYNEDPFTAAVREVEEETGLTVLSRPEIIAAYTHDYGHDESVCDLIMFVRRWEGEPEAKDDVAALQWQSLAFLESAEFAWPYHGIAKRLIATVPELQHPIELGQALRLQG